MRVLTLLVCAAAGTVACGQEITVLECDGHVADDTGAPDAGFADSGLTDQGTPADLGIDAGLDSDSGITPDGGGACSGAPYCLTALIGSEAEIPVRSPVIFTPTVDNPQSRTLTFRVELAATERRASLPPAVLSDLQYSLNVDPSTGLITFAVNEVPTWFTSTTFRVRLLAKGPGADPEVSVEATVKVRGNILISGSSRVYAMASDGRPARSQNFGEGELLSGTSFVRTPRDLLLAQDGSLIVYDFGTSPRRLKRFALTGENVLEREFDYQDAGGAPYFTSSDSCRGLTQLPDGRIAAIDFAFARAAKTRVLLFNADGSYASAFNALDADVEWNGLTTTPTGDLVTVIRDSDGALITVGTTGTVTGMIATGISNAFTVTRSADGYYYVGAISGMIRVSPQGGRQMVAGIQTGTSDYYQYLSPFGPSGVVITRDSFSASDNVGTVTGATFDGWLRQSGAGNPAFTPTGVLYLD